MGGRVGRESWEVRGLLQPRIIFVTKSRHLKKKYVHDMELKLTGCIGIVISLLQTQKNRWNSDVQNFFWQNFEFLPIFRKKIQIFGFARDIWRHNFVTPWPILVIEVSMGKGAQYLSIDTKTKFIETLVAKIQEVATPLLVRRTLQKIRWLDEG